MAEGAPANSNQLDYFMHVYHEGNFAAAARMVPMSAQGLAKAIHALESELGVPLFTTGENGSQKPTLYAEELHQFCEARSKLYDQLREGFRRIDGRARETIHLAASIGSLSLLGMEFVSSFTRDNPGVDVICDDLPDVRVEDSLRSGLDTLGITVLPTPEEFKTVDLAVCDRYVWVNALDPLARKRQLDVRDLAGGLSS